MGIASFVRVRGRDHHVVSPPFLIEALRLVGDKSVGMCVPGIGRAKADDIMRKIGIAENRRVQGLGCRQRDLIIELTEKVK